MELFDIHVLITLSYYPLQTYVINSLDPSIKLHPTSSLTIDTVFKQLQTRLYLDPFIPVRLSIKMALAPKFAGQKFSVNNTPTLHTLELYLDYVCPYSAKMYNTVYGSVFPLIRQKYASKVQILFRQQIQPWHPSSTLVHEAGVAVLKLQPNKFFEFSKVHFPSLF